MTEPETFLDGRVSLYCGDMLEVLASLPENSVDSVVCDPPYHLTSIVKRFGAENAAPAKVGKTGAYTRASAGFMGKKWDGGDVAFQIETWAAVFRVLKPGGHLIAFSGTRTYHRMVCAIDDAGFEIRDQIGWAFGSGFPKSHDVSKGIDKRKDWSALPKLQSAIASARKAAGISQSEAARRMGLIGPEETLGGGGFMWFETGMRVPTREQWPQLKAALSIGDGFDLCFEEAEREVTGAVEEWTDRSNYALTSKDGFRRDNPASELAREWQGWGTALKPAWEPVVLARKTLVEGTVAANVLRWRTGALNIDGCRVNSGPVEKHVRTSTVTGANSMAGTSTGSTGSGEFTEGRWPANVVTDGSAEVIEAFPDTGPAKRNNISDGRTVHKAGDSLQLGTAGRCDPSNSYTDNGGSAARFFYSAKADADDRLGSKHPTIKPVDLMQYLVRLVTPKGGLVLDPFAGTGTTGEAAFREGMRAVLIEREPEYQNDIRRRMGLVLGGPEERRHASIKARGLADGPGPLFEAAS